MSLRHSASCATQPTEDTTQDFFVDVFQDNIVIIQIAWRDGVLGGGRRRRCRFGPCCRGRSWHLQGELSMVREPVVAVIMRPREKKVILLRLADIDQAIAAHEIEFFAFLYAGLTMPCPLMDYVRVFPLMRGQACQNRFHLLRSKERSATSATKFREALVELGITMNHYCHTLPPLPKINVHVSSHYRIAHTVCPSSMSYISAIVVLETEHLA